MAGALGATLLFAPAMSLLIYGGLGLGLALPMLILAFVPGFRRVLPAPGPWTAIFRRWMALPTGLAALALLWLFERQAGSIAAFKAAFFVLLFSASLVWIGVRQKHAGGASWRTLVPLGAAAAGLVLIAPAYSPVIATPASEGVQPFSEARLEELRREHVPVFLDFSADWCLTCKINERMVIDRADTRQAFREAGIVTLRGDWTNGDPAITRFLSQHGRNSIPFYLYYPRGEAGEILPQLLNAASLRELAQSSERGSTRR